MSLGEWKAKECRIADLLNCEIVELENCWNVYEFKSL